jgi:hypothetical protein
LDSFVSDWLSPTYLAKDKGAGYPLDATNPQDYAHRLKVNGYYTDAEGTYANGLTTWYNLLTGL